MTAQVKRHQDDVLSKGLDRSAVIRKSNKNRSRGKGNGLKVLVVDDSLPILDLIKDILTGHNYEVETSDNGAQALDKYAKFKPDIVTLDLAMPVMDGYETLTRLLRLDSRARIIMLSAAEHEESIRRCLQEGAIGYIVKPCDEEQILNQIESAFSIGYDRNNSTFFSLVVNKFDSVAKKMFGQSASVILKDMTVKHGEIAPQISGPTLDLSQLKSLPEPVQPREVLVPRGFVGYVCEFTGELNGKVMTFARDENLGTLVGHPKIKGTDCDAQSRCKMLDFFSILNQKVISTLVNTKRILVNAEPTRLYDESKDSRILAKEVDKVLLEINLNNKKIPVEIQLVW